MMNFIHAQVSALGKSIGAGLRLIADLSQLQSSNYELQKTMLTQENQAAGVNAQATVNAGLQDQIDMQNQAYGEYANAGFTALGSFAVGGTDAYDQFKTGGLSDCNKQLSALDENDKMFNAEDNRRALGLKPEAVPDDGIPADLEQISNARQARAKAADPTKQGDLKKLDLEATSDEDYKAIKSKAQSQRKTITRQREAIEANANSRRQSVYGLFQSGGGLLDATFKTKSAAAKAEAANDRALSQIAQYSSGASQGSFQADSQSNSALAQARDAEYQFLQAIARSNQPN